MRWVSEKERILDAIKKNEIIRRAIPYEESNPNIFRVREPEKEI